MVVQLEPLSCSTMKRVSVAVSQLELDMFVVSFHGSRTDPELLRDTAGPETGASQGKDMQLAVSQVRSVRMCCRLLDDFMNRAQRAFGINLFRLSRYGENPRPGKTRSQFFEEKNPVVMA